MRRPTEARHRPLPPLEIGPDDHLFYRFELTSAAAGRPAAPVHAFSLPVTVTIVYGDAQVDGLLEDELRLVTWRTPGDEQQGTWTPVTATVNVTENVITAQLSHFSEYGLLGEDEVFFLPRLEAGQVSLFTGDSSFSYELDAPSGVGGLKVPLTLKYSSGIPNGMKAPEINPETSADTDWVGVGWTMEIGKIEGQGPFNLTLNGLSGDLQVMDYTEDGPSGQECDWDNSHCDTGTWRRRHFRLVHEEFARIESYFFDSDHGILQSKGYFELWTKDGTHYTFGSVQFTPSDWGDIEAGGPGSRLSFTNNSDQRVYVVWLLDSIVDPHGNRVQIDWWVWPKIRDAKTHLKEAYPTRITYTTNGSVAPIDNNSEYAIVFSTSPKAYDPKWNDAVHNRLAFTGHRLDEVRVYYQRSASDSLLVRKYILTYADDTPNYCQLDQITQYGADGNTALPPTVFEYTNRLIGWKTDDGGTHTTTRPFLRRVRNGYGGVLTFDYSDYCLPEGHDCATGIGWGQRQLLLSRTLSPGVGAAMVSNYTYQYPSYTWKGPSEPYNPLEQFIGFGYAREQAKGTSGPVLQQTVTWLHNTWFFDSAKGYWNGKPEDPKKGKILETWVGEADGSQSQRTTYTYTDLADDPASTLPNGIHFVYVSEVAEEQCFGDCASTKAAYYYDLKWQNCAGSGTTQYGNLTRVEEYESTTAATPYRTTLKAYCPNTTAWIVDKLALESVYQGAINPTSPNPNQLRASTWYIYDNNQDSPNPNWQRTAGNRGELRGVRRLLAWAPTYQLSDTRYRHDAYGNVMSTTTYSGYGTDGAWATAGARTTTTTYDEDYVLPVSVVGPTVSGYTPTETREYYEVNESGGGGEGLPGQLKRVRDANNGGDAWYQYNTLGRLVKVWKPDDTPWYPNPAATIYDYDDTARRLYTAQRDDDGSGAATYLESWQFYDGLGRLLQSQTEGRNSGEIVLADTHYDALGRQERVTAPQYWTVPGGSFQNDHWIGDYPDTTTTYDALGRTTRVTNPDDTFVGHRYGVWYDAVLGKTVVYEDVVDENRHRKQYRTDAFGRLVRVQEMEGACDGSWYLCGTGEPQWTVYANTYYDYDELDNLTGVKDAASNESGMAYDMLGRKTSMDDPDMGHWSYQYDALGHLTEQTDNKGQSLFFTYDVLNRLTKKDYPSGSDVFFKYDNYKGDAGSKNSWGRLRVMYTGTELANGHLYEYDERGQVAKEQIKIDGVTYTTAYDHDEADRVIWTTYPGGEFVRTEYNSQGLPKTVIGDDSYVDGASYTELGQPSLVTLGGASIDAQLVYDYYGDDKRLQRVRLGVSGWVGRDLYLEYTYDNVGNVTQIADKRSGVWQYQGFGYGTLDRLTSAATSGAGTWGTYSESYSYSATGNLESKAGVVYTYQDATHKHAATHLNGVQKYWYDANGNMTTRKVGSDTYTHTWDYENRLTQVKKNGATAASYTYDGNGVLVKKVAGGVTTVYVGPHYEKNLSSGQVTKYYLLGGQRIAMRQGSVLYWLAADHLGTTSVVLDGAGNKVAESRHLPYGAERWSSGTLPTDYRWTGQRSEPDLGLYHMGARFYDSALGRWISADSIVPDMGGPQFLNRYTYVSGHPLNATDPSGHMELNEGDAYQEVYSEEYWHCYLNPASTGCQTNWEHVGDAALLFLTWAGGPAAVKGVVNYVAQVGWKTVAKIVAAKLLKSAAEEVVDSGMAGRPPDPANIAIGAVADSLDEFSMARAHSRAVELQGSLPANARGRVTMAVGIAEDSAGSRTVLVGTSEGKYLRPGVREAIRPHEVVVPGSRSLHAEQNVVNYAMSVDLQIMFVGAGRPICPACEQAIVSVGGIPASPTRSGRVYDVMR